MTTWTCTVYGYNFIVTADDIKLAIEMIEQELICNDILNPHVDKSDLVPCPVHHRYIRKLP